MKKTIILISLVLLSFKNYDDPKKLKVELTLQQWQSVLSSLPYSKQISASDATELSNEIVSQLQPQIPKDTTHKK